MSFDVEIHEVPEGFTEEEIACEFAAWCGHEITKVEGRIVRIMGLSQTEPLWRRGPRVVEVYRPSAGIVWLTLRHADDCLKAICRGFAFHVVAKFTQGKGWVTYSTRPNCRLEP